MPAFKLYAVLCPVRSTSSFMFAVSRRVCTKMVHILDARRWFCRFDGLHALPGERPEATQLDCSEHGAVRSLNDVVRLSVCLPRNARTGEIDARAAGPGYKPQSPETQRAWDYWASRAAARICSSGPDSLSHPDAGLVTLPRWLISIRQA
jgi:hypothetical protein